MVTKSLLIVWSFRVIMGSMGYYDMTCPNHDWTATMLYSSRQAICLLGSPDANSVSSWKQSETILIQPITAFHCSTYQVLCLRYHSFLLEAFPWLRSGDCNVKREIWDISLCSPSQCWMNSVKRGSIVLEHSIIFEEQIPWSLLNCSQILHMASNSLYLLLGTEFARRKLDQ